MSQNDVHLQRILELIGPFPTGFVEACEKRANFFDEQGDIQVSIFRRRAYFIFTGSLIHTKDFRHMSIEDYLRSRETMGERDIGSAAAFIRRCLTIDPSARPTALELLGDEWLKNA